jgi:hypothetical protein
LGEGGEAKKLSCQLPPRLFRYIKLGSRLLFLSNSATVERIRPQYCQFTNVCRIVLFYMLRCCGSESQDPGWNKFRSRIRDQRYTPRILFLRTKYQFFGLKILKFFDADANPGSGILVNPVFGMEKIRSGINIPDPQHCSSWTL